jgi:hypothetical protein
MGPTRYASQVQDRRHRQLLPEGPYAQHGSGTYTITSLMPAMEGHQPEYRIKHFSEEFERVAFENELSVCEP